jgi:hypothetical protein
MNRHLAGFAAAVIFAPAFAVTGLADEALPPSKTADEVSTAAPADELVCHYETPTGSRMRVKICRTQAQIKTDEEDKRRALDEARARSHQPVGGGD